MPFLTRRDLSLSLRKEHDKAYRNQLRQALLDPALTNEGKQRIMEKLARIGQPRVYDANSPPPLGAITLPTD